MYTSRRNLFRKPVQFFLIGALIAVIARMALWLGERVLRLVGIETPDPPFLADEDESRLDSFAASLSDKPQSLFGPDGLDPEPPKQEARTSMDEAAEPESEQSSKGYAIYQLRNLVVGLALMIAGFGVFLGSLVVLDQVFNWGFNFLKWREGLYVTVLKPDTGKSWIELDGERIEEIAVSNYEFGRRSTTYRISVLYWNLPAKLTFHRGNEKVGEMTVEKGEDTYVSLDPDEKLIFEEHRYSNPVKYNSTEFVFLDKDCPSCFKADILPFTKFVPPAKNRILRVGDPAPEFERNTDDKVVRYTLTIAPVSGPAPTPVPTETPKKEPTDKKGPKKQ